MSTATDIISKWPDESREAAQLVVDKYGEPQETTPSLLVWHQPGPWKRMTATAEFSEHQFPSPHNDSVESVIGFHVPPQKVSELAAFDGSVVVDRTQGELSARCHDEEANNLALNLARDIVTDQRSVSDARQYYAKEFLDYRRGLPTPYMNELRFGGDADAADPGEAIISDAELQRAAKEGTKRSG